MQSVIRSASFLFVLLIAVLGKSFAAPPISTNNTMVTQALTDVSIGHRTSDSTGSLSISNSQVQQSIIPTINWLAGKTMTSENCTLMISRQKAYLVFNVTDTAGVKSGIAIELYEDSNDQLTFRNGIGKEFHMSTGIQGCSTCNFKIELGMITSASCNGAVCKTEKHFLM